MAGRVLEFFFKADNRSAIKAIEQIATKSTETTRTLKRDSEEEAASFRKVEESSSRLRDSFMGLAGMVGIGGVAFGLRDLKNSAVALQSNQMQLDNALRNTGQLAGDTSAKLKDYAESLSTKGGFGTTENLQALTQFVGETHSATQAQAMLALSTNIARQRGLDMATVQQKVARAYAGSTRGLQQLLGPMVTSTAATVGLTVAHQKQIATLQDQAMMMGKMGSIWLRNQEIADHITAKQADLAALENKRATGQQVLAAATREFSGATAAYMKTTAGQASNLSNSFHNLTEELGMALLPAFNWLIARGASVANWMAKNKTIVLALVGAFGALGAAMGIRTLIKSVHELAKDIEKLAIKFGLMQASEEEATAAGVEGAGAMTIAWDTFFASTLIGLGLMALIEIATHWKQFEALVIGVWQSVTQWVTNAWHSIENAVSKGVNWIWGKIKWLGEEAKKVWQDSPLGGLVGFGTNLLGGHVGRAFGALAQGESFGAYQASSGSFGVPMRNLWEHQGGGQINIHPGRTHISIDGREVFNAVTRYALNRAARGPSSFVGGSLVTGAPGLPVG